MSTEKRIVLRRGLKPPVAVPPPPAPPPSAGKGRAVVGDGPDEYASYTVAGRLAQRYGASVDVVMRIDQSRHPDWDYIIDWGLLPTGAEFKAVLPWGLSPVVITKGARDMQLVRFTEPQAPVLTPLRFDQEVPIMSTITAHEIYLTRGVEVRVRRAFMERYQNWQI